MPHGPIPRNHHPKRDNSPIHPPFPDIAIGSGRRAIAYIRYLRRLAKPRPYTVILKDPRARDCADLIWVPEHDRRRGANVLTTLTGPHGFDAEALQQERQNTPERIAILPHPRIAILLGDPINGNRIAETQRFVDHIRAVIPQAGSFLVTPSRRTPAGLWQATQDSIKDVPGWIWDGHGDNPYRAMLAHADQLIVTGDSHNMISEATATGRPVLVYRPLRHRRKLAWLADELERLGVVRTLRDGLVEEYQYDPPDASGIIAAAIKRCYVKRQ